MTKKAQLILSKFIIRVNLALGLFNDKIIDKSSCLYRVDRATNDFNNMIFHMFTFNLLSNSDFHELFLQAKAYNTTALSLIEKIYKEEGD